MQIYRSPPRQGRSQAATAGEDGGGGEGEGGGVGEDSNGCCGSTLRFDGLCSNRNKDASKRNPKLPIAAVIIFFAMFVI